MKNVVITGSTRGIGLCMAKEFLRRGCNVTLSGRGEQLPESVRAELSLFEQQMLYVPCNVQSRSDVQNLWDESSKQWGRVDIWINNAGQNAPHEFIYNTEECYVNAVIATNINGVVYGCQVAAAGMIRQKSGAIHAMEGLGSNNMLQPKTIL